MLGWIRDFLANRKQHVIINGTQSQEANVSSGIPQGSVLGPMLFVIFINDLPANVKSNVKMFADDTKVFVRSDTETGPKDLQDDLDLLQKWSDTWLLKFHPQKCSVMKLGGQKSVTTYHMIGKDQEGNSTRVTLKETASEKDLGVLIDDRLTFKDHVAQSTKKANRMVGLIRRSFDFLTASTFIQLYKSLVRPLLEYGHCVWQPHHKTLCSDIEDVQRRATKLLGKLKEKSYPERLKTLGLPSLEHRRLRGDMIEVYKYLNGYYDVQRPVFQPSLGSSLRGSSLKLQKNRFRLDVRGNYFSNRVVTQWNSLPDSVVLAPSINSFKSRLDRYWWDLPGLFNPSCQC